MSEITIEVLATGSLAARLSADEAGLPRRLTLRDGDSVSDVLERFGLSARPLLVILAERVIAPDARATTRLEDGDRLVLAPPIRAG